MAKFAVYSKDKSFLFDIHAESEDEALRKAKASEPDATEAVLVCEGDLGVRGL